MNDILSPAGSAESAGEIIAVLFSPKTKRIVTFATENYQSVFTWTN